MKVSVKTLKGIIFQVEANQTDTVSDLKKSIETIKGSDVYPAAQQLLVHQGKVLKDETSLEDNKVGDNSFILIMKTKKKRPRAQPAASAPQASPVTVTAPQAPPPADRVPAVSVNTLENTDLFPHALRLNQTLDSLGDSEEFEALRVMVRANPEILQPMLQEVGRDSPDLLRLIQGREDDFLRLLREQIGGEPRADAMPQAVTVTQAESEAIGRLEAMGFDRAVVLQVFFACDKNELVAANYLLDHMD